MGYDHILTDDEKRELLRIARATIKEYLMSGRLPPGAPHRPSLVAPAAVFVSLHQVEQEGETLRGCIGTTAEGAPIYRAVQEMAVAAATRDPRCGREAKDLLQPYRHRGHSPVQIINRDA